MNKRLNSATTLVTDSLRGIDAAYPQVKVDAENRIVFSLAKRQGRVGVISGGGSGHEPMHGGFVGPGMLDAACIGEVFTSPTPDQILSAALKINTGAGVLFVVKNYTGDVLSFEMAAELAKSQGIQTATVVVGDEATSQAASTGPGRRGMGSTLIVDKIAGAAAARGLSLEEIRIIAQDVADSGRSMGVGLSSCSLPALGRPTFELPDGQMELGVGIHGEPGRHRVPLQSAIELSETIVRSITADAAFEGQHVIAMLSGLGGTPLMELSSMFAELHDRLTERNIYVARSLVGNYMTSLDMAGCSLTVVPVTAELLEFWDAPVNTPALRWKD